MPDEFVNGEAHVSRDATQQDGRQVPTTVHWDVTPVSVAELLVGTTLAHFLEPSAARMTMTSRGLRTGMGDTRSGHDDDLGAHVLAVQHRFPVIEKHRDDFRQVLVEFREGVALAVRSRKPGHVPDVEARLRATFHDGRVGAHLSQRYDSGSTAVKRSGRASLGRCARAHQPADLQGVRHQSVTDFLRGAPLGGSTGDEH